MALLGMGREQVAFEVLGRGKMQYDRYERPLHLTPSPSPSPSIWFDRLLALRFSLTLFHLPCQF